MQSLPSALPRLERLKALVDEYSLKQESTERTREIAQQIPVAYGEVEDVYRHFAGDSKVEMMDRGQKKTFRNFFEAGWLSGRTFHVTEGRKELDRVVGRVRAAVEDSDSVAEPKIDPIENAWTLLHPRVQLIAGDRFRATHCADAVEAAFKELGTIVKGLVLQRGGPELDGVALMQTAFSPNKPLIVLADISTQTGKDMQRGYMDLFAGAMSAIRNPKAHGNVTITPVRALHLLFLASTLWYTLDERP